MQFAARRRYGLRHRRRGYGQIQRWMIRNGKAPRSDTALSALSPRSCMMWPIASCIRSIVNPRGSLDQCRTADGT
ncbi:hypothetical protein KCP78_20870 [Salmonella enterica subsp. enterica]|nr:hypothetical protein KCP78_20870 [Salmonella enterica subsp. enterica]